MRRVEGLRALGEGEEDVVASDRLPVENWSKLRSPNRPERVTNATRHRPDVGRSSRRTPRRSPRARAALATERTSGWSSPSTSMPSRWPEVSRPKMTHPLKTRRGGAVAINTTRAANADNQRRARGRHTTSSDLTRPAGNVDGLT
jgi:hypothetical protein